MEHDHGGWCTPSMGGEGGPENNLTEKKEEAKTVHMKPWTFKRLFLKQACSNMQHLYFLLL